MADWEDIKRDVDEFVSAKQDELEKWQAGMLERIEHAKQSDILTSLQKINARLDKIEDQLTEKDKPAEGDDSVGLRPKVR